LNTSASAAKQVQEEAGYDPEDPVLEGLVPFVVVETSIRSEIGLLRQILGVGFVPSKPKSHVVDLAVSGFHERVKSLAASFVPNL
jgi:hypothetical protein